MTTLISLPSLAFGNNHGYVQSTKNLAKGIFMPYAAHQLRHLRRIPADCYTQLVGNAVDEGGIEAVAISPVAEGRCLERTPSITTNAPQLIDARVLPLPPFGLNLIRVDQNFGGSLTVVRYVIVSVVANRVPNKNNSKSQLILLRRFILPPDVMTDTEALKQARRFAFHMSH